MPYGLSQPVLNKLIIVFQKIPEIEEVVLFGSRAKGTYKEGSDIDLALKGARLDMQILRKIELYVEGQLLPYRVDIILFHQIKEEALIGHINRVGICIYKNNQ